MNKLKQIIDMLQDEKIIEEIIGFIQWAVDRGSITEKQREKSDLWITWLEKRAEQKTVSKTEPIIEGLTTEFQKQVSHLIASAMDKEHSYTKSYIEWVAQSLLGYAKNELTSTDKNADNKKLQDIVIEEISKYIGNKSYKAPWALDSTGVKYPLHFAKLGAQWQKEQKPALSKDDYSILNNLIVDYEYAVKGSHPVWKERFERELEFLKSFKEKVL